MKIRKFAATDADYAAFFALMDAVWTDQKVDPDHFRHYDASWNPAYLYQRLLAEEDGQVIGVAIGMESWWLAEAGSFYLTVLVHPDWRRRTIGTQLYESLKDDIHDSDKEIRQYTAETRADQIGGLAFLARHGFCEDHRYPRSELQLATVDWSRQAIYDARMAEQNIAIEPLSALMAKHRDWREQLYELEWVFAQDEPTPEEHAKTPFAEWCKRRLETPLFMPEGWFVAVSGGRFVGLSCLWPDKQIPERMHTGWTGVDRPFRRRGLATAMKLRAAAFARSRGVTHIRTDNHEENWMFQINLRLGFTPLPAFVTFKKDLLPAA